MKYCPILYHRVPKIPDLLSIFCISENSLFFFAVIVKNCSTLLLPLPGVFGFERDVYRTAEMAGTLEVCVVPLEGVLETQIQGALQTASGSASGKCASL